MLVRCSYTAHLPLHPPLHYYYHTLLSTTACTQLTQHMAEEFYGEHKGKPFYPGLVEFMTSGPIMAVVLAKKGAIAAWRELMGPTDVFEARVRAPKT